MCKLCFMTKCPPRCANYTPEKASHYCSICNEGITPNEQYIQNDDGQYAHYECFYGIKDLLKWLGYEIKTMKEMEELYEKF